MIREWEVDEYGKDGEHLVRLATEDEVVPGEKYYMKDLLRPNVFYPTVFSPEVSWDTIQDFLITKRIYVRLRERYQTRSIPNVRKSPAQQSLWD